MPGYGPICSYPICGPDALVVPPTPDVTASSGRDWYQPRETAPRRRITGRGQLRAAAAVCYGTVETRLVIGAAGTLIAAPATWSGRAMVNDDRIALELLGIGESDELALLGV